MTRLPYRPRAAITRGQTYIALGQGTGLITREFGPSDMLGEGKREAAAAHARSERALLAPGSDRDKLYALQEGLIDAAPVNAPLQHLFPPGLYMRTIFLPAGATLVGKIHKHRHGNILSMGHVRVFTEFGGVEDLRGPLQMISEPGTKRAVKAITDTVWTTIHLNPTNTQDLKQLEDEIIAESYHAYEMFAKGDTP